VLVILSVVVLEESPCPWVSSPCQQHCWVHWAIWIVSHRWPYGLCV